MTRCGFARFTAPLLTATLPWLVAAAGAHAQVEPFIGQVSMFANTFCPRGWTEANGQVLSISQYTALFSLIGTTYGGDGRTTFALPDLRGRAPVGFGQGPGLSNIPLGGQGGAEQVAIAVTQLPPHSHMAATTVSVTPTLNAAAASATTGTPAAGVVLADTGRDDIYAPAPATVALDASAVSAAATATTTVDPAGGGQPLPIRPPYLGMRWCVALVGIFPSRN